MKLNKTPSNNRKNQVRIIGGQYRSQLVEVLSHQGLRPSADRVRETVFNWMNHQWGGVFEDKRILDAFAGSGAFGLECVSRGAQQVLMLDTHEPTIVNINKMLHRWQVGDAVRALNHDALTWCAQRLESEQIFDWVVLDPPFGQAMLEKIAPLLERITGEQTWLYVEVEPGANLDVLAEYGWAMVREGKTAQVKYSLWAKNSV